MPALVRLAPRLLEGSASGGISSTAIAVLVCVGIVPVIAVIWVCVWLLFFYGKGRNCCCRRRKKGSAEPATAARLVTSEESLDEKTDYSLPQRPTQAYRTESGSSSERPRDSRTLKKHHPRESLQSQYSSNSTILVQQEPKPFV